MDGCDAVHIVHYARRCPVYDKTYAFIHDDGNGVCKPLMEFVTKYWPQLVAFLALMVAFVTMKVDISVLKEKVKTLFSIINRGIGGNSPQSQEKDISPPAQPKWVTDFSNMSPDQMAEQITQGNPNLNILDIVKKVNEAKKDK